MSKRFILMFAILMFTAQLAVAGFNFTGNGGRSAGMGNAFTGVADDATAISWNSAGLTQLYSMEASVIGRFGFGSITFDGLDSNPDVDYKSKFQLNFLSFIMPLNIGQFNVVGGIAYRNVIDFNEEYTIKSEGYEYTSTSEGGVNAISPALAIKFNEIISAGVVANIFTGETEESNSESSDSYKEEYSGFGLDIGIMVKPSDRFSIGANLNLPYTLKIDDGNRETEFDVPFFYSVGATFRATDKLLLAFDYHSRNWSDSDIYKDLEDTDMFDINSIHVGLEYLVMAGNSVMPLRLGFQTNPLSGTIDRDGEQIVSKIFSLGAGLVLGNFILDGAIELEPYSIELNSFGGEYTQEWQLYRVTVGGVFHFGE